MCDTFQRMIVSACMAHVWLLDNCPHTHTHTHTHMSLWKCICRFSVQLSHTLHTNSVCVSVLCTLLSGPPPLSHLTLSPEPGHTHMTAPSQEGGKGQGKPPRVRPSPLLLPEAFILLCCVRCLCTSLGKCFPVDSRAP